jgi:uncharacterized protein (DUF58 family)
VRRSALPKLRAYSALAAVSLFAAVVLGRPELVALAAPFALFLALSVALLPAHDLTVELVADRERAIEGDALDLGLRLVSENGIERLELQPSLPPGLEHGGPRIRVLHLRPGSACELELPLRCRRWGGYALGALEVRAFDRFGIAVDEHALEPSLALRVYPSAERLQRLVRPLETQPYAGNLVARTKGDGIEFADVRAFTPGDRVRRVNWRVSARRGALYVNESHPERNADVVLFLDTLAEASRSDESTLDRTVRAAMAIAGPYLDARNRVGLIDFGGMVRWLTPASGTTQSHRIVEALLESQVAFSYVWRRTDVLPPRTLPPQSLVLALSPLLDERGLDALVDLRGRGFDMAILDISPLGYVGPARDDEEELALRLWRLSRGALRYRYERMGVPVVEWHEGMPLAAAIEEVRSFRRHAGRLRV